MEEVQLQAGIRAIVMHESDHVATALDDLEAGETVDYRLGEGIGQVQLLDAIPFGHKFAIRSIGDAEDVRKYGEVIGRSAMNILPGQHVHVHNVEGIRGRGDRSVEGGGE